jgi:hypothetical protein
VRLRRKLRKKGGGADGVEKVSQKHSDLTS